MTAVELAAVVTAHGKWLRGEEGGSRAYLAGANLAGADLADANLADANLARAYLADAYLAGANLADAYLAGANLAGANLADAYLAGANLAGADLADANLAGARGLTETPPADPPEPYVRATKPEHYAARAERFRRRNPGVPVIDKIDRRILDAIGSGGRLKMGNWHTCATTHCRAGWAITIAGEAGAALEREHGPHRAAMMLYLAATGRVPHFFATNERALEDLRARAEEQS